MRKVIVSMNVTLDGYMAGPGCELDWHFKYWNDEMSEFAGEQLSRADTILLGRITYSAMAGYWPLAAACLTSSRKDIAFTDMMNNHKKVVFSRTLATVTWNNTSIITKDPRNEISKLKQQPGKDIIIYGSGSIVSSMMRWELIDEYALWVHPVILGKGRQLFKDLPVSYKLNLVTTKAFDSGVVLIYYRMAKQ